MFATPSLRASLLLGVSLIGALFFRRRCFSVWARKQELRAEIKQRLSNLTDHQISIQSRAVCEAIQQTQAYRDSKALCAFLSMSKEVNTRPLLEHAFLMNKRVFVPRIVGSDIHMLEVHNMQDIDLCPRNKFGIAEPPLESSRANVLDHVADVGLIVVPGMAFDESGRRLGHGRGYYDRFLKQMHRVPVRPVAIGVGFETQRVDLVPTGPDDIVLDRIITARATGTVANGRGG